MPYKLICGILFMGLITGCGDSGSQNDAQQPAGNQPANNQQAANNQAAAPAAPPAAPPAAALNDTQQSQESQNQTQPKSSKKSEPQSPTAQPGMKLEKAQVGAGAKGNYGQGIVATPASVYWKARERIMFEITIPDCIRAYKFEHDFKGPKTHEEFMEQIVKKHHLQLPELPLEHRYIYDPKTEQLLVEKPE